MSNWEDLRDLAIVAYEESRGEPPSWTHLQMSKLATSLLDSPKGRRGFITEQSFLANFKRFLAKRDDKFPPIRNANIGYFADHFDDFGPEPGAEPVAPKPKLPPCPNCEGMGTITLPRVRGQAPCSRKCPECNGTKVLT